jgi:hypothetical protein
VQGEPATGVRDPMKHRAAYTPRVPSFLKSSRRGYGAQGNPATGLDSLLLETPRREAITSHPARTHFAYIDTMDERRSVSKGQRAMVKALRYPDAEHGGTRKKSSSPVSGQFQNSHCRRNEAGLIFFDSTGRKQKSFKGDRFWVFWNGWKIIEFLSLNQFVEALRFNNSRWSVASVFDAPPVFESVALGIYPFIEERITSHARSDAS